MVATAEVKTTMLDTEEPTVTDHPRAHGRRDGNELILDTTDRRFGRGLESVAR